MAEPQSDLRRKAYTVAKEIGLTRTQRIELSNLVMTYDHASWSELSEEDLARVVDAMCGYVFITYVIQPGLDQ